MSLDVTLYTEIDMGGEEKEYIEFFSANITHNLNTMADWAGIYFTCWRPDEKGYFYAKDLIQDLELGLKDLKGNPEFFKKYDAENGWGTYEDFVPWVEEYLNACKRYPKALIAVSR